MPEIKPPQDHVEIAVSVVERKLEAVIGELCGLMQAENYARRDAFNRAKAVHDHGKPPEGQGERFVRIGEEYQVHKVAYCRLKAVVQASKIALDAVRAARGRYTTTREENELRKLLAVFDAQDKITE